MIEIKQTANELLVLYKGTIIIHHQTNKPAFFLGTGDESIDFYRGNFKIEDYIIERVGLKSFDVENNKIRFYREDTELIVNLLEIDNRLQIFFQSSKEYDRFWVRINAEEQEKVYGCGEQASYFNLRGRNFPLWTSEPGVGRDKATLTTFYADIEDKAGGDYFNTYYPETTFVSTKKYWLHAHTYAYADFNFKNKEFHELFFWNVPEKITISVQDSYLDIVEDIVSFVGRSHKLPEYVLDGIILGVQGGMETVNQYLELAQSNDIQVSGLWCQDWAGYKYTTFGKRLFWNWILNEEVYPDLKNEIIRLNQKGVAFLGYICPFLLENESLFEYAKEHNYLAYNKENEVYLVDFGEFYSGVVDLTNPEAFNWFKEHIKTNLIGLGMKGWMADFGEYLPTDIVLYNGVDAKLMHNEWPVLWARCNYEAVQETNKEGEVFYFMRSGSYTSQKYATALWTGDQSVNWEIHDGIPSVIPSSLSTGIIGNPFTHSDIGGYTSLHGNIRTKELFERWLEMSVFTSIMRTHEGNRPSENFQFYNNQETMKLMAKMTKVRQLLKPYIKHLFEQGNTKGYPVQRPMFMHYEEDPHTYDLQYHYLFGQDVLVAPVVQKGQNVKGVYLPDDEWVHLFTGEQYKGNQNIRIECNIGTPPVFYRYHSAFKEVFEKVTEYCKKGES